MTNFTRHGGPNCSHTSLIDRFYINKTQFTHLQCNTNTQLHLNSDHLPVALQFPPQMLVRRPPTSQTNYPSQFIYPIPQENIQTFLTEFNETNLLNILQLTNILQSTTPLTPYQWVETQNKLNQIIQSLSDYAIEIRGVPPPHNTNKKTRWLPTP